MSFRGWLTRVFGEVSWTPPRWWAAMRFGDARRRGQVLLAACVLLLLCGLGLWLRFRPAPERVHVVLVPPTATPWSETEELIPVPLRVQFDRPVAPVDATGGVVSSGLRIVPALPGEWRWEDDRNLRFQPETDWPAGRRYRLEIDRTVVADHVRLQAHSWVLDLPEFKAELKESGFYQDPEDAGRKEVYATVEFTHPVVEAELRRRIRLEVLGEEPLFPEEDGRDRFQLSLDPHGRRAVIRSVPLLTPEREAYLRVTVARGVPTSLGSAATPEAVEAKVRVPDKFSFFRIESVASRIVWTDEDEPEQILFLTTRGQVRPEDLQDQLTLLRLPDEKPATALSDPIPDYRWRTPAEVERKVLAVAERVGVERLPTERPYVSEIAFRYHLPRAGQLFVEIGQGAPAFGGYELGQSVQRIVDVALPPKAIEIQGRGGVMALSGDRRISVKTRGVKQIELEVARVPHRRINHLVSMTGGSFESPWFRGGGGFSKEHLAEFFTERRSVPLDDPLAAAYTAFDLGPYLDRASAFPEANGERRQGLFFVTVTEVIPETEAAEREGAENPGEATVLGTRAERFILVSDLGLLLKQNRDDSREVYVVSLSTREPVAGAAVEVLGLNGVPLMERSTDADGCAFFPSLTDLKREKRPVAVVVSHLNDLAFLPFERADRRLNYSRFPTGGVTFESGEDLDAYLFSERGVFRPGDEIRAGLIVKRRDWGGGLEGIPILIELRDARGRVVREDRTRLPANGLVEFRASTSYVSPTGVYGLTAYLYRDEVQSEVLARTSVRVEEFEPERLNVDVTLTRERRAGWVHPTELEGEVRVVSLFGLPAAGRRVKADLALSPTGFRFPDYEDFVFYDPLRDRQPRPVRHSVPLGELVTDAGGEVVFGLDMERFKEATYLLTFRAEAFEQGGGRGVAAEQRVRVSALPFVLGVKPDGDLDYVGRGSERSLQWVALDADLHRIAVKPLRYRLLDQFYRSVLVRQPNGNLVYESVQQTEELESGTFTTGAEGGRFQLRTDRPGNFVLEVFGQDGGRVGKVSYAVVGEGEGGQSRERNAELDLKLARERWQPGEEIELSITAPYAGTGLITIERDRVIARKWFRSEATSGRQTIRLPEDFEGTGYVNVAFVRALDSPEVFMSPLSYGVAPFTADYEPRRLDLTLEAPDRARPGEPFRIGYRTDRACRMVVFAVDEGILQITSFATPAPLEHFFRKSALQVGTWQILDLLMPEFRFLDTPSAFGGGEGVPLNLNLFRRTTDPPVAFWSGVLEAGPSGGEVVYEVPDYFNGTLRIMAVAVANDAVGAAHRSSLIRGPFVISPSVPAFAAPGDEFEVSVTVANTREDDEEQEARVVLSLATSEHLEVVRQPEAALVIPNGGEATCRLRIRVRDVLGAADLTLSASDGENRVRRTKSLSVRPATPFMTRVTSGHFASASVEVPVTRDLYPNFRRGRASLSNVPLGLARGLEEFLAAFPYGCTEQLISGAFSRLILTDEADFGLNRAELESQLERLYDLLRTRQAGNGAFGYWDASASGADDFLTAYAVHFLTEAREAGFTVPRELLRRGLARLQEVVRRHPSSPTEARTLAYAIYVLTRNEVITTTYLLNLRDTLSQVSFADQWEEGLTAVYLAGTYALLQQPGPGRDLLAAYAIGRQAPDPASDFYRPLGADAQFVAVAARHFPEVLRRLSAEDFQRTLEPIGRGEFNSLTAAYAILALRTYSELVGAGTERLAIRERPAGGGEWMALDLLGDRVKEGGFSVGTQRLRFERDPARTAGLPGTGYYQIVEAGFDRGLPTEVVRAGLEVFREYRTPDGKKADVFRLGDPVQVRLAFRSLGAGPHANLALVDLLPCGFQIERESLSVGKSKLAGIEAVNPREDRAILFGSAVEDSRVVSYRVRPTVAGRFILPPIFAESMYDRSIRARGLAETITVEAPESVAAREEAQQTGP